MTMMYFSSLLLVCYWVYESRATALSNVELVYPRDGDRIYPSSCAQPATPCSYELDFIMILRPASINDSHTVFVSFVDAINSANISTSFHTNSVEIIDDASFTEKKMGGKFTWTVLLSSPFPSVEILFSIENQLQMTVYSSKLTVLLMLDYDGDTADNLLDDHRAILETMCSTKSPDGCVLDFVELGTSSFGTVIQRIAANETGVNDSTPEYKGISLEAVKYHIQKLPRVRNVLKINAAISMDAASKPYADVFYIPRDVLLRYDFSKDWYVAYRMNKYIFV